MKLYEVNYRLPGAKKWNTIERVKGDTLLYGARNQPFPGVRVIICEDETRWEIPATAVIRFSPERFDVVKKNVELEAGQSVPTHDGRE